MQDRLFTLDRVHNFRDFGGWDTGDGAKIARGKLYRSASFHDASEADIARLDALNVTLCVDLRRPEERAYEPNRWPSEACKTIFNEDVDGHALPPHLAALLQNNLTADSVTSFMHDIYRGLAFEQRHIELYRAWFRELAQAEGAAVLHCSAGKDRTGLGCALTLVALGVDEESVFADYEFTNVAVDPEQRLPRIQARMEERLGKKFDAAALRPMLSVSPDYLRAALDAIDARHGSVQAYLNDVLGIGDAERQTLREKLAG